MQLKVQNLGKIKEADIDIRPLTVFVGPNGTNKTWTAYALYGLTSMVSLGNFSYFRRPTRPRSEVQEALKDRVQNMASGVYNKLSTEEASETR